MKRLITETLGGIPFFLMAADSGKYHINVARIVEAVIIAGIAGLFAAQMTTAELKIKLAYLEGQNNRMEMQIKETCGILQDQMKEITRIDTIQKERLFREGKLRP